MKWIPYGPHSVLLQFGDEVTEKNLARCLAFQRELEENPPIGLVEAVPGFTTLLLEFDARRPVPFAELMPQLIARLQKLSPVRLSKMPVKEIPIVYDGPDLESLAESKGLTVRKVCELHAAPVYHVYLLGFSPGFPYLGKLNPKLHAPRRASPRPSVPAGSVAIGGEHTGIYTVPSPGGWNIIGHTPLRIFRPETEATEPGMQGEAMFYLKPGDRVKFIPEQAG